MRMLRWKFPVWSGFWKLGGAAYLCGLILSAGADDVGTPPQSGTTQKASTIQFTVIDSKTVQEGNHTVTYNRVAPLPLSVVFPTTNSTAVAAQTDQGSQALQQLQTQQQQKLVSILVSATVFNHQITQFNWTYNGVTYQGYSNVDFTILAGDTEERRVITGAEASAAGTLGEDSRSDHQGTGVPGTGVTDHHYPD